MLRFIDMITQLAKAVAGEIGCAARPGIVRMANDEASEFRSYFEDEIVQFFRFAPLQPSRRFPAVQVP